MNLSQKMQQKPHEEDRQDLIMINETAVRVKGFGRAVWVVFGEHHTGESLEFYYAVIECNFPISSPIETQQTPKKYPIILDFTPFPSCKESGRLGYHNHVILVKSLMSCTIQTFHNRS